MSDTPSATPGRHETADERADRNWIDLLQELRVSQTGVQLLAGFLVTLPFQERFEDLTGFERGWYIGLLCLALLIIAVMLTPVAIHRRLFGGQVKQELVRAGHVLTEIALGLIALLLVGIGFLVIKVVAGLVISLAITIPAAVVLVTLMFVVPRALATRWRE